MSTEIVVDVAVGGTLGDVEGRLTIHAVSPELAQLFERAFQVAQDGCHEILNGVTPPAVLLCDLGKLAQEMRRRAAGGGQLDVRDRLEQFRQMAAQVITTPTTNLSMPSNRKLLSDRLRRSAALAIALISDLEKGQTP